MANTFELISSVTVGSGGAASIDFTSIPATYTDLCLKVSSRGSDTGSAPLWPTFNGSSANLSYKRISGTGSAVGSVGTTGSINGIFQGGSNQTANTYGNGEMYIPNYAGSQQKSVSIDAVNEDNSGTAYSVMVAGLWANTAAINRITLTPEVGTINQYSTAYLYGVKNA